MPVLLESGDYLLLENGDRVQLENEGGVVSSGATDDRTFTVPLEDRTYVVEEDS